MKYQIFKNLRLLNYLAVALFIVSNVHGQTVSDFQLNKDVLCQQESLDVSNTSSNYASLFWDFCVGDFQINQPEEASSLISGTNAIYGYKLVEEDNEFYSFVISRGNSNLFRLYHGTDPSVILSVENLGTLGLLTNPEGIDIINFNDKWYGVIGDLDANGSIIRFDLDSLDGPITATDLGTFGFTERKRDVRLIKTQGNLILIFSGYNTNSIVRIDYGNSFDNVILSENIYSDIIAGLTLITGFDIKYINGSYLIHVLSRDSQNVIRLDFGNSLLNTPTLENTFLVNTLNQSYRLKLIREGAFYYGIVGSETDDLQIFNFGSLDTGLQPQIVSYSTPLPALVGFQAVSVDANSYIFGGMSNNFFSLSFIEDCGQSTDYSSSFEPDGVYFNTSGEKQIWLQAFDSNGNASSKIDTLTILNQTAPSISFSTINACAIAQNTFTSSPPGLTYSWDFDEDGIEDSNLENPSYQFPASGTYTVRLDVDDGTCGNFTEQIITLYEEPPIPSFQVDGNLCSNVEISFTNLTPDGSYVGPLVYEWDFNGEATASTKDASYAFSTAGMKTITLTSSIPGCENITQQVTNLVQGPTSLFSAIPICEGELMTFTNQSVDADSYLWDFGDGSTSTQQNVTHIYASGGTFTVILDATDTNGCTAQYQQDVVVSPVPLAGFDFDIPCSGGQGIAFFDQSTVDSGDILSWEWSLGGVVTSTEQNPIMSFDESGSQSIVLKVISSSGCEAEYQQTIEIIASPTPTFSVDVSCQNLSTQFTDTTPEATVVSRLWTIDGQNFTSREVDHIFTESGNFNVSLTITSEDFCSSTTSSTIEILVAPSMAFTLSSNCASDEILLSDTSTPGTDSVVSRSWLLDGEEFFNGGQAQLSGLNPATYEITLQSTTEIGCVFSITQMVDLLPSPKADFQPSVEYGVPPFEVSFTNTSTNATSYSWLVNGTEVSTSSDLTQVFLDEGNHTVELIVTDDNGCTNGQGITILSALPVSNLIISDVTLTPNGSAQTISLNVLNSGNLPIEIFDVIIQAGTDFSVSERINQFLDISEQTNVVLSSSIQAINGNNICVSIVSAFDDILPDDNEECVSFVSTIILEDPYPNPVQDEATIRLILPKTNDVSLSIVNSTGKRMISEKYANLTEGLNIFRYDFSQFEKGIYFVTVRFDKKLVTKRILKF